MGIQNNEIKIVVPSGMEIDKENSTFECIKFKPIKKELPKTWKEFCETHPRKREESFIDTRSKIREVGVTDTARDYYEDENLLPSKKLAEAMLALCQLIQLRDCYNDGWEPNWANSFQDKFVIYTDYNKVNINTYTQANRILAFRTEELRDQFFENFIDLIEVAKPLL